MNITFDDYSKAVKLQYEQVKNDLHSEHLINPSPAQLRNLCMVLYKHGLSKSDDASFRKFFNAREDDNLEKVIEQFGPNKFKAIQNFLIGDDAKTNKLENLNLIAVLIDFNPRPLSLFLKQYKEIEKPIIDVPQAGTPQVDIDPPKVPNGDIPPKGTEVKTDEPDTPSKVNLVPAKKKGIVLPGKIIKIIPPTRRKRLILVSSLLIMLLSGFATKAVYFSKECMQWQGYQYVCVDCDKEIDKKENKVVAFEENSFKLKKLNVNSETDFFDKDTPIVWYSKQNNIMEYFNAPGLHPVTGKTLKEITKTIIMHHIDTIKKADHIIKLAER